MEKLPGQRLGSSIYFYRLEPYHLDTRYNARGYKYYRCASRTTDARCVASVYLSERGVLTRIGTHNHPIDRNLKNNCLFKQEVRQLAQNILLEPDEVLRQACRQDPESGERCSTSAMISFIKRVRKDLHPPVPRTVAELGDALQTYALAREIYQGTVTAGGSSAIIFASPEMLEFLRRARWLHIDGTFLVVPRDPKASQLWIIFIREGDKGYAAVFVLCQRRTKVLYDAIWQHILQLCPELSENLRAVWTDFEQGAVASLRENFPRIRIRGCWFHFCRAVYRKWKSFRMVRPPKEILYLSWGLPLLPADQFAEGCRVITALADPLAIGPHRSLNDFTHYLRRQWVPLVNVTSVYGTPIRTNNVAEAFNRRSSKKLGGSHPTIWIFVEKLTETINDEATKMKRWRATGRSGKKTQHKAWVRVDENIAENQWLLRTGRYDVEAFLRAATTPYQRLDLHYAARRLRADGEVEHELPVPDDILNPQNVFPDDPAQDQVGRRGETRFRHNYRRVRVQAEDGDSLEGSDHGIENSIIHEPVDIPAVEIHGFEGRQRFEADRRIADDATILTDVIQNADADNVHVDAVVHVLDDPNIVDISEDSDGGFEVRRNFVATRGFEADERVFGNDATEISVVEISDDTDSDDVQELERNGRPNDAANASNGLIGVAAQEPPAKASRCRKKNLRKRRRRELRAQSGDVQRRPYGHKRRRNSRRTKEVPRCVVCLTEDITHILIPCGHNCFCENCAAILYHGEDGRCPKCRSVIEGHYRSYGET